MSPSKPRGTNRLFVTSIALCVIATLLSATNVVTVLSAPERAPRLALAEPFVIGFEGYAADGSGVPIADGSHSFVFKLYSVATGGTVHYTQSATLSTVGGYYSVALDPTDTIDWTDDIQYVGVTIDGGAEISPRTRITAVPYALHAQSVAWSDITGMPGGFSDGTDDTTSGGSAVTGTGTSGQLAVWNSTTSINAGGTGTLSGGLNVGSATSAGTGEIRASGDVRLTAGGLYVGANTDPGNGNVVYTGDIKTVDGGTTYTGYIYVPISEINLEDTTSTVWGGGSSRNTGTYTFDLQDAANGAIPANAKAVVLLMSGNFSTASQSNSAGARPNGGSNNNIVIRALVANISSDNTGIVNIGTNGDIQIVVSGATMNSAVARVIGYFI